MTQNHRNRSWRGQWLVHRDQTVAVHKSGFRVLSGPQGVGFDGKDMLRPQDDFVDLYRRGLQLLDEVTGRRPLPHWVTTPPVGTAENEAHLDNDRPRDESNEWSLNK